jgi:hypothetical protein
MNLVEVDPVDPEARETCLELAPDRIGCEVEHDLAGAVDARPALREDERTSSSRARDRATDDRFGVSAAVRSRGVDPVDAELEGPFDGGERVAVLLVGPAATPLRAARGPRTEPDPADAESRCSERRSFQLSRLLGRVRRPLRRLA